MAALQALTGEALARATERLRHPAPGGKVEAAIRFGIDVTLLIENLPLTPAERARRMLALSEVARSVRGAARRTDK